MAFLKQVALLIFAALQLVLAADEDECKDAPKWVLAAEKRGGKLTDVAKFVILLYMFLGLVLLCDGFYVTSLETIKDKLNLKEDVVGASFMAFGNAVPELSVALVAALSPSTVKIGPGAVVGSCMFNLLVTSSACCLVAAPIKLSRGPILRELLYWMAVSAILLAFLTSSKKATMLQSLCLVGLYGLYMVVLFVTDKLWSTEPSGEASEPAGAEEAPAEKAAPLEVEAPSASESTGLIGGQENTASSWVPGDMMEMVGLPFFYFQKLTIPDCSQAKWANWYLLTFLGSILHIALYSRFVVFLVARVECTVQISSLLISFLLVGLCTNVPDMISNMLVARKGMGGMAIASCLGSNVCTLSIGLGMPWLIATLLKYQIPFESDGMVYSVVALLVAAVIFLVGIAVTNFTMYRTHALVFLACYAAIVVSATMAGLAGILDSSAKVAFEVTNLIQLYN